jgi:hypothetical protein
MMQTIEAVIDEKGKVHLLEPVNLKTTHRVFITILPNKPDSKEENPVDITNLGEILDDDFDTARREISQTFFDAIENSAEELEKT